MLECRYRYIDVDVDVDMWETGIYGNLLVKPPLLAQTNAAH